MDNYFGSFGDTASETLPVLEPVLKEALAAHSEGNYAQYTALITDELKEQLSEEQFMNAYQSIAPELGRLQSLRFLGSLDKNANPSLLYAARYSATRDDVLIYAAFRNESDPPKIDWLWIE